MWLYAGADWLKLICQSDGGERSIAFADRLLPSEFRSLQGLDLIVSLLLVLLPRIQTPTGAVAHVTVTTASGSVERFQLPLVRRTRVFMRHVKPF